MNSIANRNCLMLCLCLAMMTWFPLPAGAEVLTEKTPMEIFDSSHGLPDNRVQALAATDDALFAGTAGGLCLISKKGRKVSVADRTPVISLLAEGRRVWAGTEKGLLLVQDRKASPMAAQHLEARRITSLCRIGKILFCATDAGLAELEPASAAVAWPQPFQKLPLRLVRQMDGQVVAVTESNRVFIYDPQAKTAQELTLEMASPQLRITALETSGDYLWFGTHGSSLIAYDFVRQQWSSLLPPLQTDLFVTAVAVNGKYLWLGSFLGLIRYNLAQSTNTLVASGRFKERAIAALAIDVDAIWIGTAGAGLFRLPAPAPVIQCLPTSRYFEKESVAVTGLISCTGKPAFELAYQPVNSPAAWSSRYLDLKPVQGGFEARIDFSTLPEQAYLFRARVKDPLGRANEEQFTLVKESRLVALNLKDIVLRPGLNRCSGTYQPGTLARIIARPGNIPVRLDKAARTFVVSVSLTTQDRQLFLIATDADGQQKTFQYSISVQPLPALRISADPVVFTPGTTKVKLLLSGYKEEAAEWQLQIRGKGGEPVSLTSGKGRIPDFFIWDGKNSQGEWVGNSRVFYCRLKCKEANGLELLSAEEVVMSDAYRDPAAANVMPLNRQFHFETGKADIQAEDIPLFAAIREQLDKKPDCMLLIEGHADDRQIRTQEFPTNQILSESRARAVAQAFRDRQICDSVRITTVGYGSSRPVSKDKSMAARAKNRRVEIFFVLR